MIVSGVVVTVCRLCSHGHWEPSGPCAWPCSPQLFRQWGSSAPRGLHFHCHTLHPHHPDQWSGLWGVKPAPRNGCWRVEQLSRYTHCFHCFKIVTNTLLFDCDRLGCLLEKQYLPTVTHFSLALYQSNNGESVTERPNSGSTKSWSSNLSETVDLIYIQKARRDLQICSVRHTFFYLFIFLNCHVYFPVNLD